MQPIPTPEVLDPDRVLDNDRGDFTADHEARAALLEDALHKSCSYARQLWDTTDALRNYLMTSLPPDPRSPGPHPTAGASPTGPDDGEGWDKWVDAYAAVTSVLCGPHGDSGFGRGEARRAAQLRRTAPNVTLYARPAQSSESTDNAAQPGGAPQNSPVGGAGTAPGATSPLARSIRFFAAGFVGVLALRGLRR